ncbi:type II toxin-antitoxin system prevent-host-death family antitoxin [Candidatus Venteria ishoeyi]|uniref:type II toxin-antitoxin system Phd/YefM family antitoxin n=1 Tax=Candidatus Venteria ishoeyi TaxID=1899563 RepID=UPI0025A5EA2F|nr:type II toxin-antitoxin system prevent-host-death family antitoxin [Candidatus Venteria ishoeyi]MDM8546269.1 type II toxin-antitoxin system prevent-host-death family antitoxin [Candidatus Venteria ishoeyi]
MMQNITYKQAKQDLDNLCEQVYRAHEPYEVQRQNQHNVVIMSLDDYNAWQETHYLLSNPHNAK